MSVSAVFSEGRRPLLVIWVSKKVLVMVVDLAGRNEDGDGKDIDISTKG